MTSLRQESTGEMETKCIILLWLSILVLIPFDISSVDTSIANDTYLEKHEPAPLVLRIIGISKDYLSSAGPMRRIAGMLLSKLLTRPDMPKAFISFIGWTHEVLSSGTTDVANHFRLLGAVEALASIFKVGSRKVLLDVVPKTWNDISILVKSTTAARSSLLRKFLVKLTQRIGLVCLPHRSRSWHYVGKSRLLGENIFNAADNNDRCIHGQEDNVCAVLQNTTCLEEEDMDVPEIIEEIIELLLSSLRDMDTVVRWSGAKGIGRITTRLTADLSDEVLSSILELFSAGEGDGSWHGGCLALAELARRGLLLPVSLPKVVPVIIKALHYDIRRGPHSVGSHVRDAAAYVCWAFGRAYSNTDMKKILEELAPHLLTVACYDREVNCRRAAAAAFQENVGRQGSFPHGIEIVNTADYFSLSSRVNSYLNIAVSIAQHKEYLYPFVKDLLCSKICHWDKGLRELAAQALPALAKYDVGYFADTVLERLIPCTLSSDLCMRHGATLAAGELVLALHQSGFTLSVEKQKSISGIVPAIEKARLYRGKGGEIMRSSVSRLIECTSIARIPLPEKIKRSLLDSLNENLKHPNAQIQGSAVEALKHFVTAYLSAKAAGNDIMSKYLQLLSDPNVAARRGSSLALGILPIEFLVTRWRDVMRKLCSSCMIEDNPSDRDAEARVNAVRGLVSVCETLTNTKEHSFFQNVEANKALFQVIKDDVMSTFFKALDDYSVDNRGDVGSWVREAAMDGLQRCTYILCERQSVNFKQEIHGVKYPSELTDRGIIASDQNYILFDESLATNLIGGILKQAVEKIDKIREIAANILQGILHNPKVFVPFILHREALEEIVPIDADLHWGVPTFSFPRLVLLLQFSCYSKSVLSGLVISVGGLQDSLRKASLAALMDYLQVPEKENCEKLSSRETILSVDLLWVLHQYERCDRVIIPTLKTIEILLSKQVFSSMEAHYTRDFAAGILDSLEIELKGSKDFSKLSTGISILGYIVSAQEPINSWALSQLLSFLGHRYPKIRKASADQVYLVLLQNGNLVPEDKMEKALETISETCWEGDLEEAKRQRLQLYELAGLEAGSLSNISSQDKNNKKKAVTDEHESYSSLVGSTGF